MQCLEPGILIVISGPLPGALALNRPPDVTKVHLAQTVHLH